MRLDKSAFKKQSFRDAADHQKHYEKLPPGRRTESFNYLMSSAFGFVGNNWPQMDKTAFQIRKQE
jgi:hypothetical protein